jgi:hypothetical protein
LIRAKKQLKKKMPTKRTGETYWTKEQFEKLRLAPAARLASKGILPWRLLAYVLLNDSRVQPLRDMVSKRLLPNQEITVAQRELNQMLVTLWKAGFVNLSPRPEFSAPAVKPALIDKSKASEPVRKPWIAYAADPSNVGSSVGSTSDSSQVEDDEDDEPLSASDVAALIAKEEAGIGYDLDNYKPERAEPTDRLELVSQLRSVNPLFGLYLINLLQFASESERIQALEGVLELPANVAKLAPVPSPQDMPFGPLATDVLHPKLLELGLATSAELTGQWPEEPEEEVDLEKLAKDAGGSAPKKPYEDRFRPLPPRPISLAEKMRRLFDFEYPRVHDVYTRGVWVVGELLEFNCDFQKYITARGFQKQEGILFRHVLRFILLLQEISQIAPSESTEETWEKPLDAIAERLIECCRKVDPESTDEILQEDVRKQ